MDTAKIYKEKAQMFLDIANAAPDEGVRSTLLRLARGAQRAAAEMEDHEYAESLEDGGRE